MPSQHKQIEFHKYQATGNDFIMVDDRNLQFPESDYHLVKKLCDRRFGIGADGLILLRKQPGYDFLMVYYNSDGKPSSFCGNGGRCIVSFAHHLGIIAQKAHFYAMDGTHSGELLRNEYVKLQMSEVHQIKTYDDVYFLNTGSPHVVKFVDNVDDIDIKKIAPPLRYDKRFGIGGANVNFVQLLPDHSIKVRTYERGVENETFSCGTGVTASAIIASIHNNKNEIHAFTPGGELFIGLKREENSFSSVFLSGSANHVFDGVISV